MLRAPCCQRLVASSFGWTSLFFGQTKQVQGTKGCQNTGQNVHRIQPFSSSETGYEHEINTINEKFAEAREEIEFAREDAETVYFNDSTEVARKAVGDVLERYQNLLSLLSEDEQGKVQRSMGLKMEQLKAELQALNELHA